MNYLIIVNNTLSEKKIEILKNLSIKNYIYILNFQENYNLDSIFKKVKIINLEYDFHIFCKKQIKQVMRILKKEKNFEFWKMKLSEFNLADNFWKDNLKIQFIKGLKLKYNIKKIRLYSKIEDYFFNRAVLDINETESLETEKNIFKVKYFFEKFYYFFINYFKLRNFIFELINIMLLKKIPKKKINKKKIFISNFPDHFDKNFNKSYLNNKLKYFHLVSLLRNNKNKLNFPKKENLNKIIGRKNFDLLERNLFISDIIKFYYLNDEKKIKYDLKLFNLIRKIGFSAHQANFLIYFYYKVEIPKNQLYREALAKTFFKIPKNYGIHYGYFEFIEGRILTEFLKQKYTNINAYQHGAVGFFQHIRCFDVLNYLEKKFIPRKIFLLSKSLQLNLKKKISEIDFYIKQNKKYKINKSFKIQNNLNILFFSDLHNVNNYIDYFKKIKTQKHIKIFFRLHPKNYKYKKKFLEIFNSKENIFLDENLNYLDSIKKHNINLFLVSSYTGVFNEIKKRYWPILIFNFKNQIPNLQLSKEFMKKYLVSDLSEIKYSKIFNNKERKNFIKTLHE